MKKLIIICVSILYASMSFSQELYCLLSINPGKLSGTSNQELFNDLSQQLTELINNTSWTNNVFARDERIECNISIILDEQVSSDEFKAKIQIRSSRPVYGTSYMSPLINHLDNNFHFKYSQGQSIEFNQSTFTDNLTAVIAFYCYIVIGMDYDSFGQNAGTPYFQMAEKIVQNAQTAQEPGWKAFENLKNRYWLVENLLSAQYSGIRDFMYTYHRLGLDKMAEKVTDGRSAIETAVDYLKDAHRKKPGSFLMTLITTTKNDEIVNIFSEAFDDQKARVVNIMKEVDPANSSKYDQIMKTPSY